MKRLVTWRWLLTHALVVGLVLLFLLLGWWQLQRAESGNERSWAYSLQWPTFALMVVGFWIKVMYDELRPKAHHAHTGETDPAITPTATKRAMDPELSAYNSYIADLANRRDRH